MSRYDDDRDRGRGRDRDRDDRGRGRDRDRDDRDDRGRGRDRDDRDRDEDDDRVSVKVTEPGGGSDDRPQVDPDEWIRAKTLKWKKVRGDYGGGIAWIFEIVDPEFEHCQPPEGAAWFPMAEDRDIYEWMCLFLDRELKLGEELDERDFDDTLGVDVEIQCELKRARRGNKRYAKVKKVRRPRSGGSRRGRDRDDDRGRDRDDRGRDRDREDRDRGRGSRREREPAAASESRRNDRPIQDDDVPFMWIFAFILGGLLIL